jgi:hypothetical protein
LGNAPILVVHRGEEIRKTDTGAKQPLFQLLDETASLPARIGILSENTKDRKKLAVTTRLYSLNPINVGASEACQLDLRSAFNLPPATAPEQRYAVSVCGDAQWAAQEHDDAPGNLHIRSLPSPWLIKSSRGEMKVNLAFPASLGNKDFQVILWAPGRDSVCYIAQCKANVVPGRIGDRTSGPSMILSKAASSPFDSFFDGIGGTSTVETLLRKAEGITSAPYLYKEVEKWYDEYSALSAALLLRSNEILTDSNAEALLRTYITLGLGDRISPEWIHRVWLLFLSVSPYEADEFLALVRDGNVDKITQFMKAHIDDILRRHRGPVMSLDVVRAVLERQQDELRQWRTQIFDPQIQDILQGKDARPGLPELHPVALSEPPNCYGVPCHALDEPQKAAIEAARVFFEQGLMLVSGCGSHVNWPRCLWKRTPVVTAAMLLEKYFPDPNGSVDQIKQQIAEDWALTRNEETGNLERVGRSLFSCTTGPHSNFPAGAAYDLNPNQRKEDRTCLEVLQKFSDAKHHGLKLMYALGRFLNTARTNPRSLEFQAIQRATEAKNFLEFLQGSLWLTFVNQVFDNSIEQDRCCDGVRKALEAAVDAIIQPEQPRDVPAWFLWFEFQIYNYVRLFLATFDFHFGEGHEEGTYGGSNLRCTVNPIWGFSPVARGLFFQDLYLEGRRPTADVLMPFEMGEFAEVSSRDEFGRITAFHSRGHKKNATNRRLGDYKFVHIAPFSPVAILYRSIRNLFQKRFTPGEESHLSNEEQEVFNVLWRLLFSVPGIRREYIAFIAPVLDTVVSEEQSARWNVDEGGLETSFGAVRKNDAAGIGISDGHLFFKQCLKFWEIGEDCDYFCPSFEACKHLTVLLGYAQWEKDGKSTDLAPLQFQDSFPAFDRNEDHPGDKNPPARAELYDLQLQGAAPGYLMAPVPPSHGDPYYIDTRKRLDYKNVNVWGEHIDGSGSPQQLPAPEEWKQYPTPDQIAKHADPIQKMFYKVVYPDDPNHMRTIYQIRLELARAENDLHRWDNLATYQQYGVLSDDNSRPLRTLTNEYPNGRNDIERIIRDLRDELARAVL